ncbi:hypothetical protein F7725_015512 [Dissostichus mawsoni]|uniref:Uncharacterized protein n=1 Tax=Dissostichus mawsoni TaxID=36200 RepID=A0A7J5YHT3_DISMA|nr:hypothetical protein F7725_015512 [Dissostichus mawsoni]
MRISDIDVVHPADAPSSHRKLLCTLWCLLVSQTSLCSLLCRLSSLSVLLIIQRQTDLRSSAAAAKEKQERWRSSIRPTGRTHEIRGQLLGGSLEEKIVPISVSSSPVSGGLLLRKRIRSVGPCCVLAEHLSAHSQLLKWLPLKLGSEEDLSSSVSACSSPS